LHRKAKRRSSVTPVLTNIKEQAVCPILEGVSMSCREDYLNKVTCGDCIKVLKEMPSGIVNTCVTSPPYYGLRDYGTAKWEGGDPKCDHNPQKPDGGQREDRTLPLGRGGLFKDVCGKCGAVRMDSQIGIEQTPEDYVAKMVEVFREVKRILRDDGTVWLNLGDSYWGGGWRGSKLSEHSGDIQKGHLGTHCGEAMTMGTGRHPTIKPKDLMGIPWRVAFALQKDGWYLRQDVIWNKPNPMPESVTDRCTKAHEYVFLLTKKPQYYFNNEVIKEQSVSFHGGDAVGGHKYVNEGYQGGSEYFSDGSRNKRSVWTVTTKPFSEAHFATFPESLIDPMIKAGCPKFVCKKCGKIRENIVERKRMKRNEFPPSDPRYRPNVYEGAYADINGKADAGYTETKVVGLTDCGCNAGFNHGVVLDPFMGSGTVAVVANKNDCDFIGTELNPEYVAIFNRRLESNKLTEEDIDKKEKEANSVFRQSIKMVEY
jgi:DNA modification methylase